MKTQIKQKKDFTGQDIFIGLDVHKKSWHVTLMGQHICLKSYTQPASSECLHQFLQEHYPGARYFSAYEAGFSGYSHHRKLNEYGIKNIVVNPADIPKTNKDDHYKTDKRDSRTIAEALRSGLLKGIHVLSPKDEEFRSLFRSRLAIAKDIRRTRNRIKSFLAYRAIEIPSAYIYNPKSKGFLVWLQSIKLPDAQSVIQKQQLIERLHFLLEQRLSLERQLRILARNKDKVLYELLQTVPGIGPITAIGFMAEIGDINRFRHIKQFASYIGMVPRIHQSGNTERIGSITYRNNGYLRPLVIEAAWQAVRCDSAILQYYQEKCAHENAKKVIVKVARKLLNRIMYVMKHRTKYERGIN
ncbi:IS110 family transposase [Carboxylicivirga taeanensis]|uniref:IS110 family transposase n=1 Tax=Carboxylicivirga taeanensis TaxID=1416875 RepID=UPI003F6DA74E